MLSFVNFRNRFWQNHLDQTSCWIILDHRINIHQKHWAPWITSLKDVLFRPCWRMPASNSESGWPRRTATPLCQAGYPLREYAKIRQVWTCLENSWVMLQVIWSYVVAICSSSLSEFIYCGHLKQLQALYFSVALLFSPRCTGNAQKMEDIRALVL